MAIQSAVLKFSLPEDIDSDEIYIYSCATKLGNYTTVSGMPLDYEYGTTTLEYDTLSDTQWYKIRFKNSVDAEWGPYSDPVYGGDFSNGAPFLALSSSTDGAQYASIEDVYNYATLTTQDCSNNTVSQALRSARALIDLRTAELGLERFNTEFSTEISRKKFNATLRILKEAEINLALGHIYGAISDDLLMKQVRDGGSDLLVPTSVTIGQTTLSQEPIGAKQAQEITGLSDKYRLVGLSLLAAIQPTSIAIHPRDEGVRLPRFKMPF